MRNTSLKFFGITNNIESNINSGKPINKDGYDEETYKLPYKDALNVDRFFATLLCNKFGERKVNEAMNNSDDELCEAHAYLESQNKRIKS